jgi:hypothetical protein
VFLLGHLGLTLLVGRLFVPFATSREPFPLGFLLAGGLLPDLVDKPLGHVLLGWDNGRLWAHTLLFASLIAVLALALASRRLGALAGGTAIHQLLDQAWLDPASWLWPLAGDFPRGVSSGAPDWLASLASDPFVWITEGLGLLALAGLLALPLLGVGPRWWTPTGELRPRQTPAADVEPEGET